MIPLMRDVIKKFDACLPAMQWAGDMDIQTGYEVCTEPGWLMLLIFSIRNEKHALSFDACFKAAYQCVESSAVLTQDIGTQEAFALAKNYTKNSLSFSLKELRESKSYLVSRVSQLTKQARHTPALDASMIADLYAAKCIDMLLGALIHRDNVNLSAKAVHSSADFCVMALLSAKYPDFAAKALGFTPTVSMTTVNQYRLAKKIELCNLLRSLIPQPMTAYE